MALVVDSVTGLPRGEFKDAPINFGTMAKVIHSHCTTMTGTVIYLPARVPLDSPL